MIIIYRTAEEAERRLRQVEQLQSKEVNLKRIYESRTNNLAAARTRLMEPTNSAFADCGTTNWGDDDNDDKPIDINVTVTDLKLKRDQLLQGTSHINFFLIYFFILSFFYHKIHLF